MKDYSQGGEQAAILKAVPFKEPPIDGSGHTPRFLDIGAWNAFDKSNTRALYELGWSGVIIEPSPGPMLGLVHVYGQGTRITLIQAALGVESGLVRMKVSNDAVSTSDPAVMETWKDAGGYLGDLMVPRITWEDIANRYGGFDFVNIDAEGLSVDLAHRMLELGLYPPVVCIEHDARLSELATAMTRAGYSMTFSNGCNAVFAK